MDNVPFEHFQGFSKLVPDPTNRNLAVILNEIVDIVNTLDTIINPPEPPNPICACLTGDGGYGIRLLNNTGIPSIKGTLVQASRTRQDAFEICNAGGQNPIGVVFDNNVPQGELCTIVITGTARVLLEDGTETDTGNWAMSSQNQAGRVDASLANPPTVGGPYGSPFTIHMNEIGHSVEIVTPGVDKLARCVLHFN